jgi:histidinol-phosphate aminotransferase
MNTLAYRRSAPETGVDLRLDANEGRGPRPERLAAWLAADPEAGSRYPSAAALERRIAERFDIAPDRVLVTGGADDALDRACRVLLRGGGALALPDPTFEMLGRFADRAGGSVLPVRGEETWPVDGLIRLAPYARALGLVTPNNPTGSAIDAEDLERILAGRGDAVVLVDAAYAEFADFDPTPRALAAPDTLVFRTFSKAWGLAGLRVGYVMGPAPLVEAIRAAGQPYPASRPSLVAAERWLVEGVADTAAFVDRVRDERAELFRRLCRPGVRPVASQANFVFARFDDAPAVRTGLLARGIAVRGWAGGTPLADALRITCPGDESDFTRLTEALEEVLS